MNKHRWLLSLVGLFSLFLSTGCYPPDRPITLPSEDMLSRTAGCHHAELTINNFDGSLTVDEVVDVQLQQQGVQPVILGSGHITEKPDGNFSITSDSNITPDHLKNFVVGTDVNIIFHIYDAQTHDLVHIFVVPVHLVN